MRGNIKNKLTISVLVTIIIIFVVIRLTTDYSPKRLNEGFVKTHLMSLTEGESYIEFKNAIIYIDDDNTFLFIDYDITYESETNYSYLIANKDTGQFIRYGSQNYFPEFMSEYNQTKDNFTTQIIYDSSDIEKLNVGH